MTTSPAPGSRLGHYEVTALSDWDLSPNGKRFLFVAAPAAGRTIPFTVVVNWAARLRTR